MGVSVYWQPLRGTALVVGPRSRFVAMLTEAFGTSPWNLTSGNAQQLRHMSIGAEDDSVRVALRQLADACDNHEDITVWTVY